ncbi:hypothetical protein EMIHUDRAFT_236856 [Emiliania huxleyi CCMP1516]|uniref:Uncharacterized protein n=2 Tax=Emiliania huxleyi TaxID=2903 RepID=A0A0D3JRX4_EMIH1|nr:hypothetical protein EMIHUDRAFT_236856 [Emiliania huxleyi CCMP1516]EOD26259.1 hypothetical protein EMIHUDRAFT_236856 [Emiliania huxleyi CCMP1516]|eukprot:XP_005778688.1 hypothetical protein EMIHUDRAFT_236856 [Emiliania huxleyi CCMP1516]
MQKAALAALRATWRARRSDGPSGPHGMPGFGAGDDAYGHPEGLLATATVVPVAVPDPVAGVLRLLHGVVVAPCGSGPGGAAGRAGADS